MWIKKSYNPNTSPYYVYEWKQHIEQGTYVINFILTPTTQTKPVNLTAYNSSSGSGQSFTTFPETIDTVFSKDGTMTFTLSLDDNNFEFPSPQFFSVLSRQTFREKDVVTNQNILKKYSMKPCIKEHLHCVEKIEEKVMKLDHDETFYVNCLLIYKKLEFLSSLLDLINRAILPEVLKNAEFSPKEEILVYIKELKEHYEFLRHFLAVTPSCEMPTSNIVVALLDPRFDNWIQSIFAPSTTFEELQKENFVILIHNTYTYICTVMSRLSAIILEVKKC